MKKICVLILLIFLMYGCETNEDESDITIIPTEPTVIETTPEPYTPPKSYVGYASDIYITQTYMPQNQRLPQKYFTSSYSNIKYSAITKELCVTAVVKDHEYQRATYYLVGRKQGSFYMGEQRIQFLVPSGDGSKTVCFNNIDLSETYEILLTKYDLDDLNPSSTMYSVNTLTLKDLKATSRKYITNRTVTNHLPEYYAYDENPYILFSAGFNDPERTLEQLHVILFNLENDEGLAQHVIQVDESLYEGDVLNLENILFDQNIAPNVSYSVQIFAKGFDGVDHFEGVTIGNYLIDTKTYEDSFIGTSYHGLFAVFTHLEVIGDDVYFYYRHANDGTMQYNDTKKAPVFVVTLSQSGVYQTFNLDLNEHYIVLPKSQVEKGINLSIKDERSRYNFSEIIVSPMPITIYYYPNYYPLEDKMLRVNLINSNHSTLLSLNIEIVDEHDQVIEVIEDVTLNFGESSYPYLGDYALDGNYKLRFTYEVETKIGSLTHVKEFSLRSQ